MNFRNETHDAPSSKLGDYCRKHSLKVILAAICGYKSRWMFKDHIKAQDVNKEAPKRGVIDLFTNENVAVKLDIGCFIEGLLFLNNHEEAEYLNRVFITFNNNRLLLKSKLLKDLRKAKQNAYESTLYKPRINQSSERSQSKSRIPVEDRLMNKQKEYDNNRKQRETENFREEIKECTFNPKLDKDKKEFRNVKTGNGEIARSQIELTISGLDEKPKQKLPKKEIDLNLHDRVKPLFKVHTSEEIAKIKSQADKNTRYCDIDSSSKEDDKLEHPSELHQQEFTEPTIIEFDNFGDYIEESYQSKDPADVNDRTKDLIQSQTQNEEEQSGSDQNDEAKDQLAENAKSDKEQEQEEEEEEEEENFPILFLDVNLGKDRYVKFESS